MNSIIYSQTFFVSRRALHRQPRGALGVRSRVGFIAGANGIWQQDGAPPHWGTDSLEHLEAHGISVENDNLLVEDESGKWPARSPDLNWLDEFVWGFMVNEIRFEEATTK